MRKILFYVADTIELIERDAKMIVAAKLFEKGKVSLGQASDLVGLSKQKFMELFAD